MKISYNWLKEFVQNMPSAEETAAALTMHSFEVEGIEKIEEDNDSILDVKILPNRAHDCLSHYGIASEIAAVCDLSVAELLAPTSNLPKAENFVLNVNTPLCHRGLMIRISGIKVGESPDWMQKRLQAVGARPINSIVDITNYLTYAFGQPMHAFDAVKIARDKNGRLAVSIREAKKDEAIRLLNGIEYRLEPGMLVIADSEKPLDLAGVMGGAESGVSDETTEIILSLSTFDAVSIRRAASKLKIRTDASQRFENGISTTLADRVLPYALKLIADIAGGQAVEAIDIYQNIEKPVTVEIETERLRALLGEEIALEKIVSLLGRQKINVEEAGGILLVRPPLERLDIRIPEDVVEEVGRLYGYNNIAPRPLSEPDEKERPKPNTDYVFHTVRLTLSRLDFSEIYTYAFTNRGAVEVANPMASDKKFLRENLSDSMSDALVRNMTYLDLIGIDRIKLFEIGTVFGKDESIRLCLGTASPKSKSEARDEAVAAGIAAVEKALGISFGDVSIVGGIAEIDLSKRLPDIAIPEKYPDDFWEMINNKVSWKSVSPYPFAVRDVAVFVPEGTLAERVEEIIRSQLSPEVIRLSLFDTFTKTFPDGRTKTSYAYRLVFQSLEKTLTEAEISTVLEAIYAALKGEEGFEIR